MQPSLDSLGARLRQCRFERGISQTTLADLAELKQSTISDLERGGSRSSGHIASIAHVLGVNALWLATGTGEKKPSVPPLRSSDNSMIMVPFLNSPENCGGKGPRKEPETGSLALSRRLFGRHDTFTPATLIALVADGDSMAPFISDGDIVVFDTLVVMFPHSGVFLFETVDGLRIMRTHVRATGRIALTRDNQDKNRYPDEVLSADDAKRLKVKGRLVLRAG
jgi:phage repressor protein C with HTH and peptisase S24 domain